MRSTLTLLLPFLLLAPAAEAVPLRWTWSVQADSVSDPAGLTGLSDGGTFVLELVVDSDASDLSPSPMPEVGAYLGSSFSLVFPSTTATGTGLPLALLVVNDRKDLVLGGSPGDALIVGSASSSSSPIELTDGTTGQILPAQAIALVDDTGSLYSDDSLPLTAPSLASVATDPTSLFVFGATVGGQSVSVGLDDLTVLAVDVSVPEPAAGVMLGTASLLMALRARRCVPR